MRSLRASFKHIKHRLKTANIELPHSKTLILAAICVVAIGITLSYRIKQARVEAASSVTAEAGTNDQTLAADERVAAAIASAQDDLLGALASSTNPFEPTPKDNTSDRFTKDILAAYAQYQYGTDDTIADPQTASDNAINNIDTSTLPQKPYGMKDLTLFVPQNNVEIQTYGSTFAKTYLTLLAPVAQNPAIYNSDIEKVGGLYRNIAASLAKIPVPNDLAQEHLAVVNDFAQMADTFPLIDGQEKDPVRALLGLRIVQTDLAELPTMFIKINQYFKQNGILFDKSNPGYLWTQVPDTLPAASANSSFWSTSQSNDN